MKKTLFLFYIITACIATSCMFDISNQAPERMFIVAKKGSENNSSETKPNEQNLTIPISEIQGQSSNENFNTTEMNTTEMQSIEDNVINSSIQDEESVSHQPLELQNPFEKKDTQVQMNSLDISN